MRSLLGLAIVLWLFVVLYLGFYFIDTDSSGQKSQSFNSVIELIEKLKSSVDEGTINMETLIRTLYERRGKLNKFALESHEILRQRALYLSREVYYSSKQFENLIQSLSKQDHSKPSDIPDNLKKLKLHFEEISRYLEVSVEGLGRVDGVLESRIDDLNNLASVVQKRIHDLQNPQSCEKNKYLIVSLNRPCAFGCNVHHLIYCFQMAYATGRTLLLSSSSNSYTDWWRKNFLPLSDKCSLANIHSNRYPRLNIDNAKTEPVLECPYIVDVSGSVPWIPPAVPKNIAQNLTYLHGYPFVWFAGQLATYLMRPTPNLAESLSKLFTSLKTTNESYSPVIGIHVRRTDKINTEAAFHDLAEYMLHVERRFLYWDARRTMMSRTSEWKNDAKSEFRIKPESVPKPLSRRVYIATDDPSVFEEARKNYPHYTFYGDVSRAMSADVSKRHADQGIWGVVTDILVLAQTDFIVCTFSSQVCRVAFELMQARHAELGDASSLVQSLDDSYYFGGQQACPHEMIIPDLANDLPYLSRVHLAGNHWDGFAKVRRTDRHHDSITAAYKLTPSVLSMDIEEIQP